MVDFTPAVGCDWVGLYFPREALEKVCRVEPKKNEGTNPPPKARCGSRSDHPLLVQFYTASNGRDGVCKNTVSPALKDSVIFSSQIYSVSRSLIRRMFQDS